VSPRYTRGGRRDELHMVQPGLRHLDAVAVAALLADDRVRLESGNHPPLNSASTLSTTEPCMTANRQNRPSAPSQEALRPGVFPHRWPRPARFGARRGRVEQNGQEHAAGNLHGQVGALAVRGDDAGTSRCGLSSAATRVPPKTPEDRSRRQHVLTQRDGVTEPAGFAPG
jgi:hypothetical protein